MTNIAATNNVSIRKLNLSDLSRLTKFEYSVSITEPHADLTSLKRLYADNRMWSDLAGAVAIIEKASGRFVGTCQFYRSAPCIHGLEIGYVVHDKSDRGKGYAHQSLRLLSDHLFATKAGIYRHQLLIEVWNTASWKVAERGGFTREGILRSCGFGEGEPADCFVYSRTHRDYHQALNSMNGPE
jgi:RimJ/RimL family protein N-acetyltransferase